MVLNSICSQCKEGIESYLTSIKYGEFNYCGEKCFKDSMSENNKKD